MSVTGILASSLFSGAGSQVAQKAMLGAIGSSSAPSAFAALQQKLSASGSVSPSGSTSVPAELTQLGQDLQSGKLSAAQADYSALSTDIVQGQLRMAGHLRSGSSAAAASSPQTGASGISSNSGSVIDPMAAAMLAYSSLQQNPINGALSTSMMAPASTFSIDA